MRRILLAAGVVILLALAAMVLVAGVCTVAVLSQ